MTLSVDMMQMLRGRMCLSQNDASCDADILRMKPAEIVRECTAWKIGDPYWARQVAEWMKASGCTVDDLLNY